MHICFNSLEYPSQTEGSGVANQVQLLARALVEAGHRVTVIALGQDGLPPFSEDRGVRVHRFRSGSRHWYLSKLPWIGRLLALPVRELERSWTAYRMIEAVHRVEPIDVIEGTETGMFWAARSLPEVPFLIRLHGEPYTFCKYTPGRRLTIGLRLSRWLQRLSLRRARLLLSPSRAHAQEIGQELGRTCPPLKVLPNAISAEMISAGDPAPAVAHQEEKESGGVDGPIVLYVGRLEHGKGVLTLLEAARQVLSTCPDAHLVLAGSRHPTLPPEELAESMRRVPGNGHVHLMGYVPRPHLFSWYRRAALCVLPSHYETFGLAALEPMAFGVPVVATAAGALPEIVENGVTGLLVPRGNAQELARCIILLLEDPKLSRRLGQNGRERAIKKFEINRHLNDNLEVFQWVANTRPEQPSAAEHVFFSPHLDDAVLSCGGLIHRQLARGERVRVITVFAGCPDRPDLSAFARHLHSKWGAPDATVVRLEEDLMALHALEVKQIEQWEYQEASYRHDASGQPLYSSYEGLTGLPASEDNGLVESLLHRIEETLTSRGASPVLYFPLALGMHVDHQLLFRVGLRLRSLGRDVRFYEDWPYAEGYELAPSVTGWLCETFDISIKVKAAAACAYRSQFPCFGNSAAALHNRLARYARRVGRGRARERYWYVTSAQARRVAESTSTPAELPLVAKRRMPALSDFRRVLHSLRWHDLGEVLPNGDGLCVDLGCGASRHRRLIEECGYRWLGIDKFATVCDGSVLKADCQRLPLPPSRAAAVVAWQVMEYVERPAEVVAEAFRVLEPGGVFVGSVSFLEPVHGKTLYGISPLLMEQLLRAQGFKDVQIRPGLSGFALMLWTWLRRLLGPAGGALAIPLTAAWMLPLAGARFLASWAAWRLGKGTGHGMIWLTETAPLEFAGHVGFIARKPAPRHYCTSGS
jgi:glycosyltransferase involved in cell wall biosynthesis/LmbE family N-acetylglucosaminyl deacetylase